MWEMIPGRHLKGLYSKKKYGSFDEAAAVCAKKGACKGVSLMRDNKFRLNSSTKTKKKKGTACWIQKGKLVYVLDRSYLFCQVENIASCIRFKTSSSHRSDGKVQGILLDSNQGV